MPECQKVKNGGLDKYDPERFEVEPFGIIALQRVERINVLQSIVVLSPGVAGVWPYRRGLGTCNPQFTVP